MKCLASCATRLKRVSSIAPQAMQCLAFYGSREGQNLLFHTAENASAAKRGPSPLHFAAETASAGKRTPSARNYRGAVYTSTARQRLDPCSSTKCHKLARNFVSPWRILALQNSRPRLQLHSIPIKSIARNFATELYITPRRNKDLSPVASLSETRSFTATFRCGDCLRDEARTFYTKH